MSDTTKAVSMFLDMFTQHVTDRAIRDGDVIRIDATRQESNDLAPFLFPDEIADVLHQYDGDGATVMIYDLFPDATAYTYSGTYDRGLTLRIYDALEEGLPVTINGDDIERLVR